MAKRQFVSFPFSDLSLIKQQVLHWSARFDTCSFLDSQEYPSTQDGYECLAAVGEKSRLQTVAGQAFEELKKFSLQAQDWLFGHFSFSLKSESEKSDSRLPDYIGFPDLFFFVPEIIILVSHQELQIGLFGSGHHQIYQEILDGFPGPARPTEKSADVVIQNRISHDDYLDVIQKLKQHIQRGDCYEINFCQEFFAEQVWLDPLNLFQELKQVSPSPFSAYYSLDKKFLICASPERYLKRTGDRILSQPIKGTSSRDLKDSLRDASLRARLAASEKDKSENVMIVDLVRNDLSRICETNSVQVTELFGIYSFAQVHQMISTITGKPLSTLHWSEMVARTFPMGSMTGAPKKRVLELTEWYEKSARGLFSGALGYVSPDQDFDFNVVIRSLLYNSSRHYLAYFAGSGITINSDPEEEYQECLVKVEAIRRILKNPSGNLQDGS